MYKTVLVVLLATIAVVSCDTEFEYCPDNGADVCEITNFNISPCKTGAPCKVKRTKSASISFDFKPNWGSETLKSEAFWVRDGVALDFADMNKDGCTQVTCPSVANEVNHYHYDLEISRLAPLQVLDIMWKLTGDGGQQCCLHTRIKVVR